MFKVNQSEVPYSKTSLPQSEAFNLEYLSRVPDVKDTVHRAPLLLHVVELMVQQFPDGTDLYSEISHVHRVSKVGLTQYIITSD